MSAASKVSTGPVAPPTSKIVIPPPTPNASTPTEKDKDKDKEKEKKTAAPPIPCDEIKVDQIGNYDPDFKLSNIIRKLMLSKEPPKAHNFKPATIRELLARALDYYTNPKPNNQAPPPTTSLLTPAKSPASALLELKAPIRICGDTHGQYVDLLRIFHACGAPTKENYLFLGDYVDRGRHSLEVINLLLALKLALPKRVHLLRGNHELRAINRNYGFLAELRNRHRECGEELHANYNQIFSYMPLAAIVSGRILCMHGGISPHLKSLDDIRNIPLPLETAKSHPLACDLLWADPEKGANGFQPNKIRAISHIFGAKEVDDLCKRLDIDLIVRAHQVVEYGYAFFADRRLITVFSASRYQEELHNYAAVVTVNKNLELSFVQLKPEEFEARRQAMDHDPTVEAKTSNIP